MASTLPDGMMQAFLKSAGADPHRRRAFTLIELLVVIAIIAAGKNE